MVGNRADILRCLENYLDRLGLESSKINGLVRSLIKIALEEVKLPGVMAFKILRLAESIMTPLK